MNQGTISFLNKLKGFGFIEGSGGGVFFFNILDAPSEILEGDKVRFKSGESKLLIRDNQKRYVAKSIRKV